MAYEAGLETGAPPDSPILQLSAHLCGSASEPERRGKCRMAPGLLPAELLREILGDQIFVERT